MSDLNIPIIEPTVDYTKIPSVNQKRTIAFINHFIAHTITFLNKFSLSCEEKLFDFEDKIQRVEASLELLEARLSTIPIADNELISNIVKEKKSEEQITKHSEVTLYENIETKDEVPIEPKVEESNMQPISLDPQYAKYFKMVSVGVPKPAVKLKMEQEKLDPSILDNPHLLVPKPKDKNSDINVDS
ncbi:WASH complex subunit 3 [Phymastichus coffea]|uniref:WASH complex subunit 3 n=1 Tax=Phymastichus coffea TaxID=108790 RepID=UPI00273B1ACF|nr:WASH complex subunit 3 [Phymastichus coffea]